MKPITAFLLTLILLLAMAACGSRTAPAEPQPPAAQPTLPPQEEPQHAAPALQPVRPEEIPDSTPQSSPEAAGTCGAELTWYYQQQTLVIQGAGPMDDYPPSGTPAPWENWKDSIRREIGRAHV